VESKGCGSAEENHPDLQLGDQEMNSYAIFPFADYLPGRPSASRKSIDSASLTSSASHRTNHCELPRLFDRQYYQSSLSEMTDAAPLIGRPSLWSGKKLYPVDPVDRRQTLHAREGKDSM
jgi:hypothetical protein